MCRNTRFATPSTHPGMVCLLRQANQAFRPAIQHRTSLFVRVSAGEESANPGERR